ncbi:glycogen debranching protein GlgX [Ruicaihuangia caeni]|uniref:Glycogen debranching protein GlgX n=1 Tax=Ruicaihuangia caeni TaxID=3042517 RepID=A0AAW6T7W6_9MICO|nr:glycogen debranching protein GlgX [Klugiella sp. YN-L-19]MDI2097737.1 glycogen debranching protein GlgX [Klugiella sp. YN-L-19]
MSGADPLRALGVRSGPDGGSMRVWSGSASAVELRLFDSTSSDAASKVIPLERDAESVWTADAEELKPGALYALGVRGDDGTRGRFDATANLLDPWARGIVRTPAGFIAQVPDEAFDWQGVAKPKRRLRHTVVYEVHVKGFSQLNPAVPEQLRGTYAGLSHPASIDHLLALGVTAVELLPVHQSTTEARLRRMGFSNYWGYNTVGFFAPHAAYATRAAQEAGATGVVAEFKGMVRELHRAGIEVVLDVVYNHTAEEGPEGPTFSWRGIDDATYYRQGDDGEYIDTTGCGNTLNTAHPVPRRMVLDSLRYWTEEMQVDGFRFDLAVALARDADHGFDPRHPLLTEVLADPVLARSKRIVEPWDLGIDGWQVGSFPAGFVEWNDGFRDRMRTFWLRDAADAARGGAANHGIGSFTRRLAGSARVFSSARGPVASVNFVTAHDGFTLADLVSYDRKHNLGNGEAGRDGADENRSWNHGAEGPTHDRKVLDARRRSMRNLLGSLLLSAGVPMITAGDEVGRSQRGNNNAYCHDDETSWLSWDWEPWQRELLEVTRTLLRLRRDNAAVRPVRYGRFGETVRGATQMDWYNKQGLSMTWEEWDSPAERTVQYLAATAHESERLNRILLVVHGLDSPVTVTLPEHEGVHSYTLLWDSARDSLDQAPIDHGSGSELEVAGMSMQLLLAH